MRILHLAAGNRWTGAAAPAFAEVEALREAGIEAHYAFVGGYKLEAKLRGVPFAHPAIEKAQNPASFVRSARAIAWLCRDLGIDLVHAHLTYDHWLARVAARMAPVRIARTFHARRVLRSDPFTQSLVRATSAVFVINEAFLDAPQLRHAQPVFTPPPVRLSEFTPNGASVRSTYGIDSDTPLIAMIGKLSKGRGFETGLRAFALTRREVAGSRLMVIGHGEHRPRLEELAVELGIGDAIIWAGYHEDDLAEHYRAADALLFTERGSDEGHRAVLEAMACGVPPVVAPIEGTGALLGPVREILTAPSPSPDDLAAIASRVIKDRKNGALADAVTERAKEFAYSAAAARLKSRYATVVDAM